MTTVEVDIDHRIHPRIIGKQGRAVRKLMEDYEVDIRFPRSDGGNPNIVTITGAEDAVQDCKDHLLNLQEEFVSSYIPPVCKILYTHNSCINSSLYTSFREVVSLFCSDIFNDLIKYCQLLNAIQTQFRNRKAS